MDQKSLFAKTLNQFIKKLKKRDQFTKKLMRMDQFTKKLKRMGQFMKRQMVHINQLIAVS